MRTSAVRYSTSLVLLGALLALGGCSKPASTETGPTATVMLKDGSKFTGEVTKTNVAEITLKAPGGETRTYPMGQVAGVQYAPVSGPPAVGVTSDTRKPGQASGASAPGPLPALTPTAPAAPPLVDEVRTIPAGATIRIRNNEAINSETATAGQLFSGVVAEEVKDRDGQVAIPKGSDVALVVRSAEDQGKLQGRSELVLDVASVTVGGRKYLMQTGDLVQRGKEGVGTNKRTAIYTGGGSALGGIIGAIAGGGKGAAIGALSGAGAGTAAQAVTRGKAVRVPSETVLTFRLEAPVQIRELR